MDAAPETARLGEYRLTECLAETPLCRRWMAVQESVHRQVIIDELRGDRMDQADAFLADVRAKAAVDHPLVGTVYEAVRAGDACYCALELLPGATLADRIEAGAPVKPARVATCLRRTAEAQIYHQDRGHATAPLGPESIHFDEGGVIRLANLVVAGERAADQSDRDISVLGKALAPLVADGQPGTTRVLTLLDWMRRGTDGRKLTWQEVRGYSEQIEQQLAELVPVMAPGTAAVIRPKRSLALPLAAAGALLLVLGGYFLATGGGRKAKGATKVELPDAVAVPAGEYPTPDGGREPQQAFRIAPHEVTIREYREFLEALEPHIKSGRPDIFDHENQPAEKTGHEPTDWVNLLESARAGGQWQGRAVSLDSPVVGVDWWDAAAYADWKRARLPTQEQWFAALGAGGDAPAKIAPGPWQAVTADTPDRTRHGLLDMAGGVAEWTSRPMVPPDNPAGRRKWVIIGGSYLNPTNGALTREWVDDRNLRRPDLGFRVVFEP